MEQIEAREGTLSALRVGIISTTIIQLLILLLMLWTHSFIIGVIAICASIFDNVDNIFTINKLKKMDK
ncbi:hypothetical protein [Weissella oryzae]|nr:hypothetical protein [Weissella oryzae]